MVFISIKYFKKFPRKETNRFASDIMIITVERGTYRHGLNVTVYHGSSLFSAKKTSGILFSLPDPSVPSKFGGLLVRIHQVRCSSNRPFFFLRIKSESEVYFRLVHALFSVVVHDCSLGFPFSCLAVDLLCCDGSRKP